MTEGRVVIVGGGFGGLECATVLGRNGVAVTLIDRRNHNLFQPLLYQVATAALSPADIAEPIRQSLGRYESISVVLAEVTGIDVLAKEVRTSAAGSFPYHQLVLATGSEYNYFGHPEWQKFAPGLKTLTQARSIRQRLLLAIEQAELAPDEAARRKLLTSIVVGGGPTGVEMAGAIAELAVSAARDFRNVGKEDFRVILVEAGPRLLASFPEDLSSYAAIALEGLGVEVLTNTRVGRISENEALIGETLIQAGTIIWGAGVKAAPTAEWIGAETGQAGRIKVDNQMRVVGHPDIYAIGDVAAAQDSNGATLPALAQVAKQQGRYLGEVLAGQRKGRAKPAPFRFKNRGNTAVIGRHAAVFDFGSWKLKGRLAWALWALVHVYLLISFEKRLLVSIQWLWRYMTRNRSARIISEPTERASS